MDPERRKALRKTAEKMYRSPGGDVCSLYISGHLTGCDRQALCGRYSDLYSRRSHYSRAAWQLLQCLSQDFQENLQDELDRAAQAALLSLKKGL